MTSLININSPLVFDATMMGALEVYARAGQATIVSPFIVGGAMAPVSVAGTLTQVLAEAMTGIAYAQLINPGCPVIFGAFVTSIDMNSGAPTFGTPGGVEDPLGRGAAGAAAEPAVPLRRRALRLEAAGRAGGLRERQHAAGGAARRGQLHAARLRLARGRAGLGLREVRARCRPARRAALAGRGDRPQRERAGDGRDPRGGAGRALPRLRAHPGELQDGVLADAGASTTGRSRPGPRRGRPIRWRSPTRGCARCSASTRRRRSTRGSPRRCRSSWTGGRRRSRTPSGEMYQGLRNGRERSSAGKGWRLAKVYGRFLASESVGRLESVGMIWPPDRKVNGRGRSIRGRARRGRRRGRGRGGGRRWRRGRP